MLLCTSGTVVGVIVDVHAHGYELCSVAQAMWSHSVSDFAHFPPKFCVSTPTDGVGASASIIRAQQNNPDQTKSAHVTYCTVTNVVLSTSYTDPKRSQRPTPGGAAAA